MIKITSHISLQPFNSFGVDVSARYFATAESLEEIQEILEWNKTHQQRLLVLGGGSNILFTHDYDGLVLQNTLKGISIIKEDDNYIYIKAMAGENWHSFVQYCVKNQYQGIENLSLIPGNVGASPMQNIGAYGVEIKDVFESLDALHLPNGEMISFTHAQCKFGYRESIFKQSLRNQFLIVSVTYKLRKQPKFTVSYGNIEQALEEMGVRELSIEAIANAVIQIRQSKLPDPAKIGNAGSFFKNPVIHQTFYEALQKLYPEIPGFPGSDKFMTKVPAAWLIEQTGWKGYRKGDAGCYPFQPLVLVNYGKATGTDIYALSSEIIESVQEKFGILLEREVNIY